MHRGARSRYASLLGSRSCGRCRRILSSCRGSHDAAAKAALTPSSHSRAAEDSAPTLSPIHRPRNGAALDNPSRPRRWRCGASFQGRPGVRVPVLSRVSRPPRRSRGPHATCWRSTKTHPNALDLDSSIVSDASRQRRRNDGRACAGRSLGSAARVVVIRPCRRQRAVWASAPPPSSRRSSGAAVSGDSRGVTAGATPAWRSPARSLPAAR